MLPPHPETESRLKAIEHQERLAAVGRYRAARCAAMQGKDQRGAGAMRQEIGAWLVRVGVRLQGTRPLAPSDSNQIIMWLTPVGYRHGRSDPRVTVHGNAR